jgi:hypothetical protein
MGFMAGKKNQGLLLAFGLNGGLSNRPELTFFDMNTLIVHSDQDIINDERGKANQTLARHISYQAVQIISGSAGGRVHLSSHFSVE